MKKQRRQFALIALLCLFAGRGSAQEMKPKQKSPKNNHFSIGYNLNQLGKDFGVGFNVNSPYIKGIFAIKSAMSFQWVETADENGATWLPYQNIRLGIASSGGTGCECLRLYGEGGAAMLILDPKISSQPTAFGGYGVFGFEFFLGGRENSGMSFFAELGGMGVGAKAEKLPGKPILSNGFVTSTGFRIYL
jgi:hypothetical protein